MDVPSTQTKEQIEVFDNLVKITKKVNSENKWFAIPLGITIKNTEDNKETIATYQDLYDKVISKLDIEGLSGKDKLTKILIYALSH